MNNTYAGIDFSMSCPAISIWEDRGEPINFIDVAVHYMIDDKKVQGKRDNLTGYPTYTEWTCNEERQENLADWVIGLLKEAHVSMVFLEDYAFSARGRVFQIGEATGLVRYKIWKELKFSVIPISPTKVKKYATGSGIAKKEQMYTAFVRETGIDLQNILKPQEFTKAGMPKKRSKKIGNPISDIIDSYYVLKTGLRNL